MNDEELYNLLKQLPPEQVIRVFAKAYVNCEKWTEEFADFFLHTTHYKDVHEGSFNFDCRNCVWGDECTDDYIAERERYGFCPGYIPQQVDG